MIGSPIVQIWLPSADLGSADRKSTRLNSSHTVISYAVFCLKKKKQNLDRKRQKNESDQASTDTDLSERNQDEKTSDIRADEQYHTSSRLSAAASLVDGPSY